jgi:hypothetical protein
MNTPPSARETISEERLRNLRKIICVNSGYSYNHETADLTLMISLIDAELSRRSQGNAAAGDALCETCGGVGFWDQPCGDCGKQLARDDSTPTASQDVQAQGEVAEAVDYLQKMVDREHRRLMFSERHFIGKAIALLQRQPSEAKS